MMGVVKIADGAYFVPSYSEVTITPAYDTRTTIQTLGPCADEDDEQRGSPKSENPDDRAPIYVA
jgi:hypothetical protein